MRLTWLGHSSVKLEIAGKVIYIDPYAGPDDWYVPASLVLVSQFHFDHCSIGKIKRISTDSTAVIGTSEVAKEVYPCTVLRPGENRFFDSVEIVGMPVKRFDFRRHKENIEELGFVILADKKTVYFMADSDFAPKLEGMNPDVLFLSVGSMNSSSKEAARTAELVGARLVIPIHWGSINGSRDDAELFKELCRVPVMVLEPGQGVEV